MQRLPYAKYTAARGSRSDGGVSLRLSTHKPNDRANSAEVMRGRVLIRPVACG